MLFLLFACSDVEKHDHHHHHENELMTTINLSFQSDAGEETFTWADVEQSGSPTIDNITLSAETSYTLSITILNELEDPAENVTEEIQDEADEHQFFFLGTAIGDLATHSYIDADANGNPLGLENDITTNAAGEGELNIVLRHMPPENDTATKTAGLAEQVASEGFTNVGGNNDLDITFPFVVE